MRSFSYDVNTRFSILSKKKSDDRYDIFVLDSIHKDVIATPVEVIRHKMLIFKNTPNGLDQRINQTFFGFLFLGVETIPSCGSLLRTVFYELYQVVRAAFVDNDSVRLLLSFFR